MRLAPGEAYESPRAYFTFTSPSDLEAAASTFRKFVSGRIDWPDPSRPRPVTLNTWEANYFKHDPARLMLQADAAAKLGIERFVLDDGWFGIRDDDTSGLGDWTVDRRKYPDGLAALASHVQSLGMEFGLWFEPEMVNPDSELFRAHPDWVLQLEAGPCCSPAISWCLI
jgi:alpha-galactosidase